MIPIGEALRSSIFKKLLTSVTGLFLIVFLVLHLSGNLFLYSSSSTPFNLYNQKLEHLGILKELAELGLIALFGAHIVNSLWLKWTNSSARPKKYEIWRSKSGKLPAPTPSNVSSRNMAITGTILLIFLILHVAQFHFGPNVSEGYVTPLGGEQARDLYRLVYETFQNPAWVATYVGAMLFLGFHLRHGFWSLWQSAGLMSARYTKIVQVLSILLALLLAFGFIGIPIYLYCRGAPALATTQSSVQLLGGHS